MNLRSAEDSAAFIHDEGGTAKVIVADVSEPDACEATVGQATDLLDGLVLNVGIGRPRTPRRLRGRSAGNPGQRGRTRVDRHSSGASCQQGTARPHRGVGGPSPAGHGLGGGCAGGDPPQRRGRLRHRADPRRRRWSLHCVNGRSEHVGVDGRSEQVDGPVFPAGRARILWDDNGPPPDL